MCVPIDRNVTADMNVTADIIYTTVKFEQPLRYKILFGIRIFVHIQIIALR